MSDRVTINAATLGMLAGAARLAMAELPDHKIIDTLRAVADAEALLREARQTDDAELMRVRRISDGAYLYGQPCGGAGDVSLAWWEGVRMARAWPRPQAERIATAMIALTGEHGIEIEPVREAGAAGADKEAA